MPLKEIMKLLVVPDIHIEPEVSNERMKWLGRLIVDRKPDVAVQLGDLMSFQSLSHHEFGKKSSEGRRYLYDIEAGLEGQDLLFSEVDNYNRSKKKKDQVKTDFHITLGNHEGWVSKEIQNNAKMEFTMDAVEDLRLKEFGWKVTPFMSVLNIKGINFSHYFPSGNMDKAASGVNVGKTLVDNMGKSCIAGHSHLYREYNKTILGPDGGPQRIWGLTAGCYFEHEMFYCGKVTQSQWWRGVLMLTLIDENGDFNIERIDMKTIKELYK